MTDPTAARRRPRFERATPPTFELTERDRTMLREVARHRLLRSDHISALLEAPHKKICDRLSRLYHAGYLDRPRAQIAYHVAAGGSQRIVYAIGARATSVIADAGRRVPGKCNDLGRAFLAHTLAVADFRVRLRLALRRQTGWRLIDADELTLRRETAPDAQSVWRVPVAGGAIVSVVPDHVFALRHDDGRTRNYLVEIDRGTMPIARASLHISSVIRKLLAYEAARQSRLAETHYGWRNFRVLILTSTRERADSIRAVIARSNLAMSPLFLVADPADLDATDVLASRWRDCKGQPHTLVSG